MTKLPRGIDQLPSGSYRVRIMQDGHKISETFSDLETAVQFHRTLQLDHKLRKHGHPGLLKPKRRLITILNKYIEDAADRVTERTLDGYIALLQGVEIWVKTVLKQPALLAAELDTRKIQAYRRWRTSGRLKPGVYRVASDVMVGKELKVLRAAYAHAGIEVPWKPMRLPTSKGGKRVLEADELRAFLQAMPEGSLERTVAETAARTGMRSGEVFALRRDSLDFETGVIRYRMPKVDRDNVIPMSAGLKRHLLSWLNRPGRVDTVTTNVFTLDGKPISGQTLRRRFHRAAVAAGIDPPIEYIGGLRNARIALGLRIGGNPYAVARQAGHTDLGLVMDYANKDVPVTQMRELADAVDEALDSPKTATSPARGSKI